MHLEIDADITGIGEVDSSPLAVKGVIEGPYSHSIATGLAHLLIGQDTMGTKRLWHRMYEANIYSAVGTLRFTP